MSQVFKFQTGGSLKGDFPGYVERTGDRELLEALEAGEFCYVLTARQMGKSSLKVRTINKLRAKGWICVDVDITSFGSKDATAEQWYFSFLFQVASSLDQEEEFEDWWDQQIKFTPIARFTRFWKEWLGKQRNQQIAIFIDEVDSMLSLDKEKFSTDDFFAALRSVYNGQADHSELRHLHFLHFRSGGANRPDG